MNQMQGCLKCGGGITTGINQNSAGFVFSCHCLSPAIPEVKPSDREAVIKKLVEGLEVYVTKGGRMKIDLEFILRDCQNDLIKAQKRIDRVFKEREAAIGKLVESLEWITKQNSDQEYRALIGDLETIKRQASNALEAWSKVKSETGL
jgi:hypothetical protein